MSSRLNITIQGACTTEVETETTLFNFVRPTMVSDGIIPSLYDLLTNAELVNGVNNFVLVCLFFDLTKHFQRLLLAIINVPLSASGLILHEAKSKLSIPLMMICLVFSLYRNIILKIKMITTLPIKIRHT